MSINGVNYALMLMLMALGLTLIFGVMHIINMAHGEFMMLGAYGVWVMVNRFKLSLGLSLLVSMLGVVCLGVIVEKYLFRRFRANLLPSLVVSIGLILLIQTFVYLFFGLEYKTVPRVISGFLRIDWLGINIALDRIVIGAISLSSVLGLILFLQYTRLGRAIRAVSEDVEGAVLQGINLNTMAMLTMIIGSALAALGGGLLAPTLGCDYKMGFPILLQALMVVVLGGMGSVPGALVASLGVGFLISFGTTLLGSTIADIILFITVILMLLFRPRGLWGRMFH
jgi:branched-chain amino acid transport system permease protein